ncbi:MAG TPA: hypothetical protein VJ761_07530, partial [Ktedonobacteraceae bacterium]|nr:hypothetical protein [Ktedonobacteraceae bacterium]
LRELTYLAEEQGLAWAADLIALLLEMKAATDQARADGLAALHALEVVYEKVVGKREKREYTHL